MGRMCAVSGCGISSGNKQRVSVHAFPGASSQFRRLWINFVTTTRKDFVLRDSYHGIYDHHFEEHSFQSRRVKVEAGIRVRRQLKEDAVPTIITEKCIKALFVHSPAASASLKRSSDMDSVRSKRTKLRRVKKDIAEHQAPLQVQVSAQQPYALDNQQYQAVPSNLADGEVQMQSPTHVDGDVQKPTPTGTIFADAGVQSSVNHVHNLHLCGVMANFRLHKCSKGGMGPRPGAPQSGMNFTSMSQSTMGAVGISTASSATCMAAPTSVGEDIATDPNAAVRQYIPALRDRKIIWTGAVEYHEKSKATPGQAGHVQKTIWLLTCRISITCTEPDLPTMKWPEKLTLQLLPKSMLSKLQSLCQNSRQVAFHFSNTDQEALRDLHKRMDTGFAGCVHFPPQSASETRIILLMFSGKKKAFIGLIPNDQSAFVQGIKNVLTQHKLKQQQQM